MGMESPPQAPARASPPATAASATPPATAAAANHIDPPVPARRPSSERSQSSPLTHNINLPGLVPPVRPAGQKLRDCCQSCARSKVRCTKEKPSCSRCETKGIPCRYLQSKRPGRIPGSGARRQHSSTAAASTTAKTASVAHNHVKNNQDIPRGPAGPVGIDATGPHQPSTTHIASGGRSRRL